MTLKSNSPVLAFYRQCLPFSLLNESQLTYAERNTQISYFAKASETVAVDYQQPQLYLVRSGAFEVCSEDGQLLDRLGEGDFFGFPSLLTGDKVSNQVRIIEDGLVYLLNERAFTDLCAQSKAFQRFFNRQHAKRLRHQQRFAARDYASTLKLKTVMSQPLQTISGAASVQQAAQQMASCGVSALLVDGEPYGIITDRDLRNRVLAQGLNADTVVAEVATYQLSTIDGDALVFEGLLHMAQHRIHHLPVMIDNKPVGMVTSSDLLRLERTELLNLLNQIARSEQLDQLVQISQRFPQLLQQMIAADARAEEIGRVLTQLADGITRRLLDFAVGQLGDAPMAWCWLCFGSQARMDMAGQSDQDNGLLLERPPTKEEQQYFMALARYVCDGLNACGYVHCPGEIMAMNPSWCLSIEQWRQRFAQWIEQPDPKATLNASVFFDMRAVAGQLQLGEQLQRWVCQHSQQPMFLAHLTASALQSTPPLGFFRQWLLEACGTQQKTLDLKVRGLALINDIARVHGLSCGSGEVNTLKRLQAAMQAGSLTRNDALNLADAHEFVAHLRMSNQGKQWQQGKPLSNRLAPESLSELVRHQLKQAFRVVQRAQDGVRLRFQRQL